MPDTDYIFISMDFHHIYGKEPSVTLDGPSYRHDPVIEAGIAYLDMRDILHGRGKGVIPGDRGSSWFKYMTPLHYIVEEFENQDASDQSPYLFAFGRSRRVQEKDLAYRLYRVFASLKKKNRRNDEVEQGRLRQLILLTFDAEPVKTALLQLGLEWLAETNVQIWDLKKEKQFETRLQQPAVFEHVLERLGIRFEDTRFGKLTLCSGNATVFMIQMILAFFYRDERQKALFENRRPLIWLRYTWIIKYTITVTNNKVAYKNIAHNKVINDKSTDDKMADNKMTSEKASDNKPTEKVTPEKKAAEGENTQETSKDNETTDAQHSDVQSAEDEVVKLSVIRKHLSAEVPDLFFNVFAKEGLGLPSQFCYPSAYAWLKKVIWKFHKKSEKATNDVEGTQSLMTLQFACLRFRCVACRKPCQDAKTMEPMKGHAGHLDRWTTEARQITGYEKLWAMCGLLHGMEYEDPRIITRAKRYTDKLEGRVAENAKVLRKLLEETPEPSFTEEEYRRSGVPRDERAIYRSELEFFIEHFDYFVEVEGDEDEDSSSIEEPHVGDYELPQLKVTPPTPQR
ncbi:hypothetical protein FPCIR_12366 [Fusarium pseudocircinatum]|uniref:Gfd2/YDR514C-like C-terminal domain-containing protein n=1 Tax=Fusarium pseudocircinatum TaxID=56676 RepID=A0A8H5KM78_9HYPO|nr:hypothetical protein FPCIR_12366 [Fusarium pseudocircinatum]